MAVPTTQTEIRYDGTGTGPYSIPFPFLDTSHIYAAVSVDGDADPVLLSTSGYSVTRLADGSGGSLRTTVAVTAPAVLVIFRDVPLTQPTVFQPAGPFPAKASEVAFDRLLMQVQQLDARLRALGDTPIGGGGGSGTASGTLTWADAPSRGAVKPSFAGQLGVERSTQTVWIARSASVGDWAEFRHRRVGRLALGYVSDAGTPNEQQALAAGLLADWEVDAVVTAGNNNYNPPEETYSGGGTNYDADLEAFNAWITAGTFYPALGNRDVDYDGWAARHSAKFSYLPGNRRYYRVSLGGGLIDLFVLHSGVDSVGDVVEADGIAVGSTQHQWLLTQLGTSTARWRVAVFHFPPVTLSGDDRALGVMAWPVLARMDLILCGGAHLLEVLRWQETMLANLSAIAEDDGVAGAVLSSAADATDRWLWADDGPYGLGRIVATEEKLEIEVWNTAGELLHTRNTKDFSRRPLVRDLFRAVAPATPIAVLDHVYLGTLDTSRILRQALVAVAEAGENPMRWTLYAGAVAVATGVLAAAATWQIVDSLVPDEVIPRGTQLWISVDPEAEEGPDPDAQGLDVTLLSLQQS